LENFSLINSKNSESQVMTTAVVKTCRKKQVKLVICGLMHQPLDIAQRSGLLAHLDGKLEPDLPSGIQRAISLSMRPDR
jgi:SulP family sulfate permease